MSDDPRGVVSVHHLSKESYRKMLQNLAWATGYNVVAIPFAAGMFAWAGVLLPPAVGALTMSVSTIVVAANAMLLRRLDLRPAQPGVGVGPVRTASGGRPSEEGRPHLQPRPRG